MAAIITETTTEVTGPEEEVAATTREATEEIINGLASQIQEVATGDQNAKIATEVVIIHAIKMTQEGCPFLDRLPQTPPDGSTKIPE